MDCSDFLERYSDYDDSLLSARELSEFRGHLASCSSCARYDRVLRKGRMVARQLPGPAPDPALIPRLQQRLIVSRTGRPRDRLSPSPLATTALAAVTLLLVATSTLTLLDRTFGPGPESRGGAAMAAAADLPPSPALATLGGRAIALPATAARAPRAWAAERVDRRLASSYSPLVTGPPAYRAARVYSPGPGSSNRRTLD